MRKYLARNFWFEMCEVLPNNESKGLWTPVSFSEELPSRKFNEIL